MTVKVSGGSKFKAAAEKIIAAAKKGEHAIVRVGFLEGSTNRKGVSIPLYAFFNEFGTKRSPPRPFFRRMIKANKGDWPKQLAGALKAADYDPVRALALEGKEIEGQLVDSINALTSPRLAKSTIKRKGFSKPLIDTGDMRKSVNSEVKTK